jgi:hypothetical protein
MVTKQHPMVDRYAEWLCETCPMSVEIRGYLRCSILQAAGSGEDFDVSDPRCYRHREYVALTAILNGEVPPPPMWRDVMEQAMAMECWRKEEHAKAMECWRKEEE